MTLNWTRVTSHQGTWDNRVQQLGRQQSIFHAINLDVKNDHRLSFLGASDLVSSPSALLPGILCGRQPGNRLRRGAQTPAAHRQSGRRRRATGGAPRRLSISPANALTTKHRATVQTIPARADAPTPRVGSASTALNDTVYLFSGRGGVAMAPIEEHGSVWSYSPSAAEWKSIAPADPAAPFPAARSYHAMANDGNDTLYVHAGCPETGRLADLWAFNVRERAWKRLRPAPAPARGGASIAQCGGRLYRMNGFDGQREQGGSLDVYDPGEDSWSSVAYPADGKGGPEARSVGALLALEIDGRGSLVTLFGERDPSALGHEGAGKMLGDVWAFDVAGESWRKVEAQGDVPQPRGWFDADVVRGEDGKQAVVVHGGLAEDNSRLGDVWVMRFE